MKYFNENLPVIYQNNKASKFNKLFWCFVWSMLVIYVVMDKFKNNFRQDAFDVMSKHLSDLIDEYINVSSK